MRKLTSLLLAAAIALFTPAPIATAQKMEAIGSNGVKKIYTMSAYKTSNQNRLNTTTPAADSALVLPMAANEQWYFRLIVFIDADTDDPDIKCGMTGPSSPTRVSWLMKGWLNNATVIGNAGATSYNTGFNFAIDASEFNHLEIEGTVTNGSNAGNLEFHWSQDVLDAVDNTTVLAGSVLIARKLN